MPAIEWPLIGRDEELRAIERARAEPGCRGVLLTAPAGTGKSRVARAVLEGAHDALVAWVQATRSAATIPLAALASLVPDEVRSDDVVQLMRRCAESLREHAGRRPVLLVIDDAQLLDPVSAALVLQLATTGTAFVLATVREGEPLPDAVVSSPRTRARGASSCTTSPTRTSGRSSSGRSPIPWRRPRCAGSWRSAAAIRSTSTSWSTARWRRARSCTRPASGTCADGPPRAGRRWSWSSTASPG
jgi:hypothetical protein